MKHRCPNCGYAADDKYPLTERLLAGRAVNGWYLSPLERRIVVTLGKEPFIGTVELADRVYAASEDPPLSADNNVSVTLWRLRSTFGEMAFPKRKGGPGANWAPWFNPAEFERVVSVQGSGRTVRVTKAAA